MPLDRFPDRLKRARVLRKITQERLGQLIGVSKAMVSYYERGAKLPSVDAAVRMSDALGVSLDYLFGLSELTERADEVREDTRVFGHRLQLAQAELFSHRLGEARARRGLTQEQLASATNTTAQTIASWEGRSTTPQASTDIETLACVLGVSPLWLSGFTHDAREPFEDVDKMTKRLTGWPAIAMGEEIDERAHMASQRAPAMHPSGSRKHAPPQGRKEIGEEQIYRQQQRRREEIERLGTGGVPQTEPVPTETPLQPESAGNSTQNVKKVAERPSGDTARYRQR